MKTVYVTTFSDVGAVTFLNEDEDDYLTPALALRARSLVMKGQMRKCYVEDEIGTIYLVDQEPVKLASRPGFLPARMNTRYVSNDELLSG